MTCSAPSPHYSYIFMLVYFRVWDAGSVLMSEDSTTPTSACAMMELMAPLTRLGGTSQPTRLTLRCSRRLIFQPMPDGSPATTGRSLQRQLWHRRGSSLCGSDETTVAPQRGWKCWQPPTVQPFPSLKIHLHFKHWMASLRVQREMQLSFKEGILSLIFHCNKSYFYT